jgi:Na+-driven multidrug efflux pump
MLYIVLYIYLTSDKVKATFKELAAFDFTFVKTYFKTSWSVIVNELIFSLGMTAYSIAYARIGTKAVATMQIATTLNNLFTVLLMGIAAAAAILIGNTIGKGDLKDAGQTAKKIGKLTPFIGALLGVIIWFIAPFVMSLFKIEQDTFQTGVVVLKMMGVFLPIRAFNMVMIVGVFRGGGDTLYSMIVQSATIWLYSVPLAFMGAIVLELPVYGVYFLICTEECIKLFFELKRLQTGKWIHQVV